MIKWADCQEGELFYEFFLPEHEAEPCEWLVRVSARGHVLGERRGRLTWTPRFGPDMGDVAHVEAVTDKLVQQFATQSLPDAPGPYLPTPISLPPVDPLTHAVLYGLVEDYADAERVLGLTPQQTAMYLELPVQSGAAGLHPFAVTATRDQRMRRLIALRHVMANHPETASKRESLIAAVLVEDIERVRAILTELGLPPSPTA